MTTTRCAECGREINLIKRSGAFRRHMIRHGEICPGSWSKPGDVMTRVFERQMGDAMMIVQRFLSFTSEVRNDTPNP